MFREYLLYSPFNLSGIGIENEEKPVKMTMLL